MKRHVLFVTYGGGHANMTLPVVRLLAQRHQVSVLALTAAGALFARAGIPHRSFRDFLRPEDSLAVTWGERLAAGLSLGPVSHEESVAYLGMSYVDLIERLGETEAARVFAEKGRQAFLPLGAMGRILESIRPDFLVATNSPRAEQAALTIAGERGIDSACLVDLFGIDELPWIAKPGYGNKIMVMSSVVRDILIEAGRPRDEIEITGNPAFDSLANPDIAANAASWRLQRGLTGQSVILFASQPVPAHPQANQQVILSMAETARRNPGWTFVVRPHPSESQSLAVPEGVVVSTQAETLEPLLCAADIVLTYNSTVGHQALLLGKPLVQLGMGAPIDSAPYARFGLAESAATLGDIESAVVRALAQGPRYHAELAPVGEATAKVAAAINSLLSNGKRD